MSDLIPAILIVVCLIWWLGAAVAVGMAAPKRGGSMGAWIIMGLIFGPIVTPLLLLAHPATTIAEEESRDPGSLSITH